MKNLIIIDLGSNSVRMAINERQPNGKYQEVKRIRKPVRLAQDMGPERMLQPRIMDSAIHALKSFRSIYIKFQDVKVMGIATAAVREARNQKTFLKRIYNAIGVHVKVLSGTQEANYDYLGVRNRIVASRYVIMDVGGGSIEIIYVDRQHRHLISLPVGAVGLSERFRLGDHVSGANLFAAQEFFHQELQKVHWLRRVHNVPLVLLGGAHRALARINLKKTNRSINELNGYTLSRKLIFTEYRQMLAMNLARRKRIPGLEATRAPVILGGLLPLITMMNHLRIDQVYFSNCGVRQGLINSAVK